MTLVECDAGPVSTVGVIVTLEDCYITCAVEVTPRDVENEVLASEFKETASQRSSQQKCQCSATLVTVVTIVDAE
jgi:hypothetical protein